MKWLFRKSKWIHKYFGLILILFLIWMSASGIILNHPELISQISVPGKLVPPQYHIKNWDRSALITMEFSCENPNVAYAAGKQGIWKTENGGHTFRSMQTGLPESRYYRKTNHILLIEERSPILLAGTDGGLYVYNFNKNRWQAIHFGEEKERVVKILKVKERILVFTPSHAYSADFYTEKLDFQKVSLQRNSTQNDVTLVRLFFDVHDGSAWGLVGKLLFDFVGLIIIFLGTSAFYIWYFPWKRKRIKKFAQNHFRPSTLKQKFFRIFFKYHLKFGIWTAAILLIMGGTAFFMRPPVLAVIANGSIPAHWYPGFLPDNPWDEKIHNALYDPKEERIIIEATDGFWQAPADFSEPFKPMDFPAPVFVMGATVFQQYGSGGFLIGSFNGIFHVERSTGRVMDLLTLKEAGEVSSVRPADYMVTGYFKTPKGEEFINTHQKGLLPLKGSKKQNRFNMPTELEKNYRMSLWNYMFELHNGRFFKDLIGGIYILLVPLGSLLFVLITLSGIFDWIFVKVLKKRQLKKPATQ